MASSSRKQLFGRDINEVLDDSDDSFDVSDDELDNLTSDSDGVVTDHEDASDSEAASGSESGSDTDSGGAGDAGPNPVNDDGWTKWLEDDLDFAELPFTVRNPGFQVQGPRPTNELQFFQLFFTDELLLEITNETNRYAAEKILKETPLRKQSVWNGWADASLTEMKAFLGLIMNMALHEKPNIKSYFSDEWSDKHSFFKDVMSRTRFLQLFWAFHVCPPAPPTPGVQARGQKVKNVVDYLDKKCRENFIPGKKIAIDESTVGFKGRIIFKMYNPQKPTKWGLRVYVLADSQTGYVSVILPYYGTPTTQSLIRPDLAFTARVVLQLCTTLLETTNGNGYHLYTDRFYTGYDLAQELLTMGIHTTGTVMANRKGLPKQIKKNKKLKITKHDVLAFRKDDNTMVLCWKDKRNVFLLSTLHNPSTVLVNRKITRGVPEEFQKPVAIVDYTANMGAVDRADHYCASYGFTRKSIKWWRKMFFWLLEVAIVNSFLLCNMNRVREGLKPLGHLKYRKNLLVQLVGDVRNNPKKRGRPSTNDEEERLRKIPHFIQSNEKSNSKDCAVCSNRQVKGGRRETVFFCETCTRKPGLHPGECFKKYHTQKKYKA